jgi:hypothetical protein
MTAFALNQADLEFVLRQIKIAEANAAGTPLTEIYVNADGDVVSAGTPGAILAIPDPHVPNGLRTVDGSYNNLIPGREFWGAADQAMPRELDGSFRDDADGDQMPLGPAGSPVVTNTDYDVIGAPTGNPFNNGGNSGNVADADPRIISNLVVDMSVNNPAAIQAWLNNAIAQAAWEEANPGKTPVAPGQPLGDNGVYITNEDISAIPNIAADEGLTASFNAWMTFFGQFFDHGLDLISKGGNGTVYIPLQPDDPLYVPGGNSNFMVLTRSTVVEGPDGNHETRNTTTPFVDQNQTYTSHASHQVFLREYATVDGKTVATGHLLDGANGGLPTWADIKANALTHLGIQLEDRDVLNIPLIRTDAYGKFIPDPATGYAQLVVGLGTDGIPNTADDVVVSGTSSAPVSTFAAGAIRIGHAFLDDIAHNAIPGTFYDTDGNPATQGTTMVAPDSDSDLGNAISADFQGRNTSYDNELLDRHFITGDGRGNENIGLTTVHHIFHSEHNRQVEAQKLTVLRSGNLAFINEWLTDDLTSLSGAPGPAATPLELTAFAATLEWDGERLFQAGRFATEMQYQHLVFEEFARKVQPNIDPFVFNSTTDIDPSIFAEFAHTVYRFGHSMLTDNMPRIDGEGNIFDADISLIEAFTNPISFDHVDDGIAGNDLTADEAAASIVRGMTIETGNEIDEFIVGSLRNSLLGLPLDLAALNIARGREAGVPTLNDARGQLYGATGSSFLKPYDNWVDLAANLKNSMSVINFIAAYGTHPTIPEDGTLQQKRDAAMVLVLGTTDLNGNGTIEANEIAPSDRVDYLTSTGTWAGRETGLNLIDLWIGGLAEKVMPFGGMLGSTFNAIFEAQLENLQDGDRFYYLTRTQGQNLLVSLEQNSFAKLIMANTDLAQPGPDGIRGTSDDVVERHIGVDSFAKYDFVLEVNSANQQDYNGSAPGVDPEGNDPVLEALGLGKVIRDDFGTSGPDANYLRFTGGEHVVAGGTSGNDTIITDDGDDGIWGDAGDDRIESGAGVDLVNGGAGNDIITDSGDTGDFLKGDEGDDVIANSNGIDILMGGSGKDIIFVGVDSTEVFAGQGDDFVLGGDGADLLMGNEGDDWLEAGAGFDTTAGDNSELFFNSTIVGHDVMFAGTDEHDFDGESGDDIMVQGESVNRSEGMFGFDWGIFKGMELDALADLGVPIFTTEQADILRNRFDKVEALSGWKHDDTLIGDDRVYTPPAVGDITATTEGAFFKDGLDQAGIDRIAGLDQIVSVGSTGFFESGNILLGGAGSDILRGRAGDDILDGDRWLNVRISIKDQNNPTLEIATVDSMKHVFTVSENPAWAGKSLFELLIARTVVPSQMHIVREILTTGASAADEDVAVFSDRYFDDNGSPNYTITANPDGSITVTHVNVTTAIDPTTGRQLLSDGVDTLRNIEVLRFTDRDIRFTPPSLKLDASDPGGTYADSFGTQNYGNTNGSLNWGPDWTEISDDNSASAAGGQIRITGGALQFDAGNGASIERNVNLSAASSARLTYAVNEDGFDAGETVTVSFAPDGVNFTVIETINNSTGNANRSFDFAGPFTANATIRFAVSNVVGNNDFVNIDNLTFTLTVPKAVPTVDFETSFTEGAAAVAIASGPSIVDDAVQMVSARVVLTNASAGDQLVVGGLPDGITGAVDTTVTGRITVTLAGAASLAAYQAAIQAISFRNTSEAPATDDRIIHVTVNDGFIDSNVAVTTINVTATNDAPVAGDDRIVTNNVNVPFAIPTWALMADDTDADGPILAISGVSAINGLTVAPSAGILTINDTGTAGGSFNYALTDSIATDTGAVQVVRDITGLLNGNGGDDIIVGNAVSNTIEGDGGNDIIFAGAGDDTVSWSATSFNLLGNPIELTQDDRDFVDGGDGNDEFVINGSGIVENFIVYSAANAAAAGIAGLKPGTEIVITRNGAVIAELDNIEEIIINTGAGNDTVTTSGNFNPTSLNFSTITVNGSSGDDTVDVSDLQSAHRILFRSNGGNDTIIGNLRAQDVVELAPGSDLGTYKLANNGNGTQTLSNGTNSITFTGSVPPQFQNTPPAPGNDEGISGVFEYTPGDVAGLEALVNGQTPASAGDDDVPVGPRDLSGHGNNTANPDWGAADEPFIRITNPHYGEADAFGNRAINPVFDGLDARNISNILGTQEAGLPKSGNDANIFFMAMGQYIDHGLDFLGKGGNGTVQIGAPGGGGPVSGDPADLTRGTVDGYDANGVPQHINHTSPYVDQNQAYGSNALVGQFLREGDGTGGLGAHLFAGSPDPSNPNLKLLPTLRELIEHHWANNTVFQSEQLSGGEVAFRDYFPGLVVGGVITSSMLPGMISSFMGSGHALLLDTNPFINVLDHYVAGDGRANENFALTSIHTIWARNHNFHVEGLEAAGFQGTAEELFQAAKMVNEAEYQRVVFDEYLETLLGGLRSEGTHGFEEYDPSVNSGISHEFAAAVFRFGHSLIGQTMTVLDANGNPTQVSLFDAFLNPSNDPSVFPVDVSGYYTPQPGYAQHGVNAIVGGIVTQPAEDVDFNIVDAVRNDLVRISADLFAFNVARGWDVGLGTLNQVRKDLAASSNAYVSDAVGFAGGNLSAYTSWEDFQQRNSLSDAVINQFKQAYPDLVLAAADIAAFNSLNPDIDVIVQSDGTGIVKGIDRVDLWVGGLAEKHINGGVVGETFWVVLHEQFDRLQDGDRFYYISRFDNFDFYENFIDGQEFADIVARNTGLTNLPEHMFETNELDDEDENADNDDDTTGNNDDDEVDEDDNAGNEDDEDEDGDDTAGNDDDEDEDDTAGNDDDDDEVTPVPTTGGATRTGTPQADVLAGTAGDDNIVAFAGDDVAIGEAGDDAISAAEGNDFIRGGDGRDVIFAGAGDDQVFAGSQADIVFGDAGADRIFGDGGNDMINAGAGNDTVFGGAGNDLIVAEVGDGDDAYFGDDSDGGPGVDTLDMSAITVNANVSLGSGPMANGSAFSAQTGIDTLWGIENVNTGSGNDTITASNAVNVMNGGTGADTFRFLSASGADGDTIIGFEPGDRLDLSAIDADLAAAGDQSFTLVTGAAFTAAGQLAVSFGSGENGDFTLVQGNIDGNADADFTIQIEGHHTLTNSNLTS